VRLQGLEAAGGVDGSGLQQSPKRRRATRPEPGVGPTRYLGDRLKHVRGNRVVSLLEHEEAQALHAEHASLGNQRICGFLARITGVDHGRYRNPLVLDGSVRQCPADLRQARTASDGRHLADQIGRLRRPGTHLKLPDPAKPHELHGKAANPAGLAKQVGLHRGGLIPRTLPAHRGVECEQEAAAPTAPVEPTTTRPRPPVAADSPLLEGLDDAFLRLDFELHARLTAQWGGHNWSVRPYLRVLNALRRRDALFYAFQPWRADSLTPLAERPFLPVIGLAVTF